MSVNDLRLRTKTLIPLGLMALTVVAMVMLGASRLVGVSSNASDIIENRDVAAFDIVKAGRLIVQIPYAISTTLLNDRESPVGLAAAKDFAHSPVAAEAMLLSLALISAFQSIQAPST